METITKADAIEAIHQVFSKYTPWKPKINWEKWHEPRYIPLDIESNLSHQVFANLVTMTRGKNSYLLSKDPYTCQLQTEIALGWLANFELGVRNHETRSQPTEYWQKKKLDLAIIDLSKPFEEASPRVDQKVGDNCRNITLIGAIEFKRNLWRKDGFDKVKGDLIKLKIAADAMGKEKFWGILVATNLWYEKMQGDRYEPKNFPDHFIDLLRELRGAEEHGYDISFRTYHWNKAEELGKNALAIMTEKSRKKDLEY